MLLESREAASSQLEGTEERPQILYEDGDVLAALKPAGLVTHPAGGHYRDTLANQLASYLKDKQEASVIRILGRLERQRETGDFQKIYLAVTEGIPKAQKGYVESPIGPCPKRKGKMQISPQGKQAFTKYEVLEERKETGMALLRLELFTGRTHQIRVHMASLGCPLAGDTLYGTSQEQGIARAALHAWKLSFRQPFTGERIRVTAPLPKDMWLLLERGGLSESSLLLKEERVRESISCGSVRHMVRYGK